MAKQGRVGLGLWDRLVLLVAWAVTCGLVYLLGFYVGKGTQERRLGVEERVVRLPVTAPPPAAGQRPAARSDLTFYDTLVSGQRPEKHDEPAPAHPPTPPAPASRPAPPSQAAAAGPPPVVAAGPTPLAPPRQAPPPPANRPAGTPVAPASAPVPAEPAHVAAKPLVPPASGGWTVVADLTRNREEAEALQRQLHGHGYDAAVVRVARDGDTWYRVRIGRFSTNAQAEEVRQRLREREGVAHVFVASE